MTRAYISIGSNIDPAAKVRSAVHLLAGEVRLLGLSTIYRTEPEYPQDSPPLQDSPPFYNGVAAIETSRSAGDLKFQLLRSIETRLGRQRNQDKNAARTIDLDLLLYGDLLSNSAGLVLPDPGIYHSSFVAIPLCELAPHVVPPGATDPLSTVVATLPETHMVPLESYTAQLRREIGLGTRPTKFDKFQFARAIARWENEGGSGPWQTWPTLQQNEFSPAHRGTRPTRSADTL